MSAAFSFIMIIAFLIILIIHTLFSYLKYRYTCDKVQGLIEPSFIGNLNLSIILLVLWLELLIPLLKDVRLSL